MASAACAHISQVLRMETHAREQDTSALHIAFKQSPNEQITLSLLQAMHTMMSRQCLNPADITLLYQVSRCYVCSYTFLSFVVGCFQYVHRSFCLAFALQLYYTCNEIFFQQYVLSNPPPVELIREHFFVDMLTDSLFAYEGVKVHTDHRPKYVYLLAYASCVGEQKTATGRVQNRQELNMTRDTIERIVSLLEQTDDLIKEVKSLLHAIRLPVIAAGLLYYLRGNLLSDELISDPEPVHFVLLDQIATTHSNLQLRYVFENFSPEFSFHSKLSEFLTALLLTKL